LPWLRSGCKKLVFTRSFVLAVFPLVSYLPCLQASTAFDISSTPANWLVSGAGAANAVPLLTGSHLSITSNENETGAFIVGGSLSNFDGFWAASSSFFLPLNATNISLSFGHFSSDDRAVLDLNGVVIGNSGNGAPGDGSFNFTDGSTLQAFDFTDQISGTITTGFNIGGQNSLVVIVNNTSTGILGATRTFQSTSDNTFFELTGVVTDTIVPEPASAVLVWSGGAVLLLLAFIRKRINDTNAGRALVAAAHARWKIVNGTRRALLLRFFITGAFRDVEASTVYSNPMNAGLNSNIEINLQNGATGGVSYAATGGPVGGFQQLTVDSTGATDPWYAGFGMYGGDEPFTPILNTIPLGTPLSSIPSRSKVGLREALHRTLACVLKLGQH
jgi:hypothetical protein